MKIYIFNSKTKEFLYESVAQLNPRKKGEYLFPPNSTTVQLPTLKSKETAVFNGENWEIKCDYRGMEIINPSTDELVRVDFIGELPDGFVFYSDYKMTNEYKSQQIKLERDQILTEMKLIDEKRIRAVCEPSIKDETGISWLDYYNSEMQKLRERLLEVGNDNKNR